MIEFGASGANGTLDATISALDSSSGLTLHCFVDANSPPSNGRRGLFSISDPGAGSFFNMVGLVLDVSPNGIEVEGTAGGDVSSLTPLKTGNFAPRGHATVRLSRGGNNLKLWWNGATASGPVAGTARPSNLTLLHCGYNDVGFTSYQYADGTRICEVALYTTELADEECQALQDGFCPLLVRVRDLRWYSRLYSVSFAGGGGAPPEDDDFDNLIDRSEKFVRTGFLTNARDHPPMLYPGGDYVAARPFDPGGPAPSALIPDLIDGERIGSLIHGRLIA